MSDTISLLRKMSIEEMFEVAIKPDPDGIFYLHEELLRADPEQQVIDKLLLHYPERALNKNNDGSIALHVACTNINNIDTEIIENLVSLNPESISSLNNFKLLPIHKAVACDITSNSGFLSLKYLIDTYPKGLLVKNKAGQLPIHIVLEKPKSINITMDIIEMIIEAEPSCLHICDNMKHYPLHKVMRKKDIKFDIFEMILEKNKLAVRKQDNIGYNYICITLKLIYYHSLFIINIIIIIRYLPLHWAISRDNVDIGMVFSLLEEYPEAVVVKDNEGRLPVDIQISRGKKADSIIIKILLKIQNSYNDEFFNMDDIAKLIGVK